LCIFKERGRERGRGRKRGVREGERRERERGAREILYDFQKLYIAI
jgi:hypothetical protein